MSKEIDAKLNVQFTQADTFVNITSGENISTSFGKISKWYADINTAITKANAAAPQSTTYTKTEIDNMIGNINTVLESVL